MRKKRQEEEEEVRLEEGAVEVPYEEEKASREAGGGAS